ncbi:MAG: hypothetical protein ACWIPH_10305 [Ostreibacterium sp.]
MKNEFKLDLPSTITATYKIITPMFIGDAQQHASQISPQSFKGVLRFCGEPLETKQIGMKTR